MGAPTGTDSRVLASDEPERQHAHHHQQQAECGRTLQWLAVIDMFVIEHQCTTTTEQTSRRSAVLGPRSPAAALTTTTATAAATTTSTTAAAGEGVRGTAEVRCAVIHGSRMPAPRATHTGGLGHRPVWKQAGRETGRSGHRPVGKPARVTAHWPLVASSPGDRRDHPAAAVRGQSPRGSWSGLETGVGTIRAQAVGHPFHGGNSSGRRRRR